MTSESDISVVLNVISDPPSGSICGWFVHFSVNTKSFVKDGLLNLLAEKVLALNDLTVRSRDDIISQCSIPNLVTI